MEHQIKLIYVYSITGSRAYFLKNITKQWSWEKIASHNKSKANEKINCPEGKYSPFRGKFQKFVRESH